MRISTIYIASWLLIAILFLDVLKAQERNLLILEKFVAKRSQFQSVSYDVILGMKPFIMEDTTVSTGYVELVRNTDDTLYGGMFSIHIEDSLRYTYDGHNISKVLLDSAIVTVGDPHTTPGLWVQSTWVDNFLDYGFLKLMPGPIAMIKDSTMHTTFCDTMIAGWPCMGIFIRFPNEGEFKDRTFFTAIDTIEYMVRSRMYSVFFQENEQYTNWIYTNVQYSNDTTIENLDNTFIITFHDAGQNDADTSFAVVQPENNYTALAGKFLGKNELFKLSEINGKIILLDFWYTSCYPCIKAIPAVNKLYHDYKDRGVVVYGINMFDDEVRDKSRLDKFFRNNVVDYTSIMVDKEITGEFQMEGYPTLLVLDENYQVIFKEVGFNENLYSEVADFLNERLK